MVYNPQKPIDIQRAIEKIKHFIAKGQPFELKRISQKKSVNQNSYFHLIVGWFAWEYGEDFEYVKQEMIKKIICPEVFRYERANEKTGEVRDAYKSFANIDKDQTTYVIDKFRDYASKQAGIYLPEPTDLAALQEIEVQLKNNEQYL
jgi:hypothetical protein